MLSLIILLFSMISTFPQSGTPTFVDSYLVKNSGETTPRYLAFNTDGTKMFIVGGTKDRLLEYTLTTGFDFSTLSYAGHSERFNLHSYDATGDSQPRGIAFNNDGTKMFVIGNSADEVNEYHLAIAFDISTASFDSRIDITATVGGAPNGLAFSADGTKMFITSNSSVNIFVFDLTTGFDVSTALFDNSESLSGYSGSSFRGITFNPDGTKMFVVSNSGSKSSTDEKINEFNLTTGFEVTTSSFVTSFDVASYEIDPQGIVFNTDGSTMYVLGTKGDDVNEFTLPSEFSLESSIVPIELLHFDARILDNNTVYITWQTVSEVNNDYFTIERSTNGLEWEELTTVDGSGNSLILLNYKFIDSNPFIGVSYYRLKQIDYNGIFDYSKVIVVNIKINQDSEVLMYPNPMVDQITIVADNVELIQIGIFNFIGQNVVSSVKIIAKNGTSLKIDVSNLIPGIYIIKTENTVSKMMKN